MMRMTREAWQQAQYRHTMADGRPAILHMVDGVTVLEVVEFTDLPPVGDRTLVEFECCGRTILNYLRPDDPRICLDCRADADRAAHGWTAENSRD